MKVFMGGTCNESDWRNRIIPMLEVGFFNPVVDDWTPDCMAEELRQREECDVCLYVITPKMTGVYSVAEVIDDSNKRPARTVFVRLRDDGDEKFTDGQWKSLGAVAQMVERNGGTAFDSLKSAALHINAVTPNASQEMPKYVCHKKVWALKIAEITEPTDATGTSRTIIPADEGYGPFVVDGAYMAKHKPEVGGYYVVYEDGYKSFSPASAFESGYTRV